MTKLSFQFFLVLAVFVLLFSISGNLAIAGDSRKNPKITEVHLNFKGKTINIKGEDFSDVCAPVVTLGNDSTPLTVFSNTDAEIEVSLPDVPNGDYTLRIGQLNKCRNEMDYREKNYKYLTYNLTIYTIEDEYVFCQSCDGIDSYSCTRQQAAEECASLGMHMCSVAELNAYAEEGIEVCCWGWTSDPDLSTTSRTDGVIAFFMGSSTRTGISEGCGGDPGGMRISFRDHLENVSAHCCK